METTSGSGYLRQDAYRVRFERGEHGALGLLSRRPPDVWVAIVVDVLSFSTAVDVAVARGAQIFPSRFKSVAESAQIATMYGALLAVPRSERSETSPYTLSPSTLDALPAGSRLVLPSPNGARCVRAAYDCRVPVVLVGCLRNASAVAEFARDAAGKKGVIAVIAAGERWSDGTLRPSVEDDLGAGAILAALDLDAALAPEARFAATAFRALGDAMGGAVRDSVSGRELTVAGYSDDVARALQAEVSATVPV
ncbi:MAG: 2-phosphosulfolactate phosphatase, partial [Candidatus Eremiobacteraeota bacterium]|nr:2-phosphosulfolactate phosphatase [Candidatus Eremiobacteraeota bacterium]